MATSAFCECAPVEMASVVSWDAFVDGACFAVVGLWKLLEPFTAPTLRREWKVLCFLQVIGLSVIKCVEASDAVHESRGAITPISAA